MLKEGLQKILNSKSRTLQAFCFCVLGATVVATWQYTVPDCVSEQEVCSYYDRAVIVVGTISDQPERQIYKTKYSIESESVVGWEMAGGKLLLTTNNYPIMVYGDRVRVSCVLRRPDERMEQYLALHGIHVVCNYPRWVEKIGHDTKAFSFMYRFKERLEKQVRRLWVEPEASLMAGILYGSRSGLPTELTKNFNKTSLSHIVAVSGYNITILVTILMQLCIRIGFWRRQAFWIVVIVLVLFVVLTGASASVVRAGSMGIIVLVGQYLGRPARVGTTLLLTATIMVLVEPLILLYDRGFQLSFGATLGLVYLQPRLKNFLPTMENFPALKEMITTTIAAQIATLPLIMYYFGQVSVVAPLTNLLVIWVIPWLMLFGTLAVVISFLVYPLGQMLAFVAHVGLAGIIGLVNWFGNQPWSVI